MAPQRPSDRDTSITTSELVSPGARVTKRRYKRVRRLENGLLDVERRSGKFFRIAMQNQRNSPLLRMPPEIRNRIYDFALGGRTFVLHRDEDTKKIINKSKSKNTLALLAVCRQLHAETAMLPFSLNVFSSNRPSTLKRWLSTIRPVHRNNIHRIELTTCLIRLSPLLAICAYMFEKPDDWTFSGLSSLRHIDLSIIITSFTKDNEKTLQALFAASGKLLDDLLVASGKEVKVATSWAYLRID